MFSFPFCEVSIPSKATLFNITPPSQGILLLRVLTHRCLTTWDFSKLVPPNSHSLAFLKAGHNTTGRLFPFWSWSLIYFQSSDLLPEGHSMDLDRCPVCWDNCHANKVIGQQHSQQACWSSTALRELTETGAVAGVLAAQCPFIGCCMFREVRSHPWCDQGQTQ